MVRQWALLGVAVTLAACGGPAAEPTSLFPLAAGHRWVYSVTSEFEGQTPERETLRLEAAGRDDLDDQPTWRRRSASGVDYWLRSDASGIYRVASKSDLDAAPIADAQRRYVLKAPIAVGTQWQASTVPYLLRRRQEFPRELRHSHPALPMTYVIEALGQRLETPAGAFDRCLRVRGTASARVYADAVVGWSDLPLTTLEWYCPGVGLARLERHEPASSTFLEGGTLTMELQSWR